MWPAWGTAWVGLLRQPGRRFRFTTWELLLASGRLDLGWIWPLSALQITPRPDAAQLLPPPSLPPSGLGF